MAGVMDVGGRSGVVGVGMVLDHGLFGTEGADHEVMLALRDLDGTISLLGPPAS